MTDQRIVPRGYEDPQREFSPELRRAGWAPGSYCCTCFDCGKNHIADKRASRCVECAEKAWAEYSAAQEAPMTDRAPFTPDEIRAAEIEAAREEGRRSGLMEAAELCNKIAMRHQREEGTYQAGKKAGAFECASAIEAKAKEAGR